jgi:hypothetical protein
LHRLSLGLKLGASALALGTILYSSNAQAQFAPAGSEFRVNDYTSSNQERPAVAMDSDGDYVVVYEGYGAADVLHNVIYARRYNASGVAQGVEFKVSNNTGYAFHANPSVAMDSDGFCRNLSSLY